VRAIEAAGRVGEYATINLGHPDVVPITSLAEMIRAALHADPALIRTVDLPAQMTLVKRPRLERQRLLLGFVPSVSLSEGVRRVCAEQLRLVATEARRSEPDALPRLEPTLRSLPDLGLPVADVS
jgi:nucleoside-diphosphate-sugar epimerase